MAAGEVIDSLGSVVRELLENALDAQACRITIEVDPERWQVRVRDDGIGIPHSDLAQVALSHTTSKWGLSGSVGFQVRGSQLLGFRGEALHSMARLGSLHLQTWAASDPHGWQADYDHEGTLVSCQPAALSRGTVVVVSELFETWPSRRATSPIRSRLSKALQQVVSDAALIYPRITWQLMVAGREILRLAPVPDSHHRMAQLLRQVHLGDFRVGSYDGWDLVIGLPDRCHRPRPDWIKFAVNGRVVNVPDLLPTLQSAFYAMLPRHRYPLCLAHLHISTDQVDWNRDPAKSELFLHHLEQHQTSLNQGIRQLLASPTEIPASRAQTWMRQVATGLNRASENKQSYNPGSPSLNPLAPLRVLAQLQNTYILAEYPTGLWLIEQHVAHERVRYQQLCQAWQVVNLPQAVLLENLSPDQVDRLTALGLDPEPFGETTWRIQKLPAVFLSDLTKAETTGSPTQWAEDLRALSHCDSLDAARIATACRTAIRNGIPLSQAQMQTLVESWAKTDQPHTCPHGRPIYLQLNEKDLARFFRRHWSICDSGSRGLAPGDLKLGDRFAQEIQSRPSTSPSNAPQSGL